MSEANDSLSMAVGFIDVGKYSKAEELLVKHLTQNPSDHEAWYYLSIAYSNLENPDKSEEAIRKAIEINGDEPEYLIRLCYRLYMKGEASEVKLLCSKIISINPDFYKAYRMLGMVAKDEENIPLAVEYFEKALENERDVDTMLSLTEVLLDSHELDRADDLLVELRNLDTDQDQAEERDGYFVRYALEKAMQGWTGEAVDDDGSKLYFPETIAQIEDSEHYLEMAEEVGTSDEFYSDRMRQMREVLSSNRAKLGEPVNSDSSYTKWYNDLPETDRQAYDSLEAMFNRWTGTEVRDNVEYRWPKTVKEISESDKALNKIKKAQFKDKRVKARYDELRGVVDASLKQVPNYKRKFIRAMVVSLAAILAMLLLLQIGKYRAPKFDFDQGDWVLVQSTDLVYDAFVGENGHDKKYFRPLPAGTQLTPVARKGSSWMQVKTGDGSIGYVYYRTLKGSKKAVVDDKTPLYTDYRTKSFTDSIAAGENVTAIDYYKEGKEEHGNIVRIKTSSGKIGFVPYYRLNFPFKDNIPEISQTFIYPTTAANVENLVGKNLPELEEKYGPVTSVIASGGKNRAFFNQLEVIKDGKKYSGIFFALNTDGQASAFEFDNSKKVRFVDKLPLAAKFRQAEPFGLISFSFYSTDNPKMAWWQNFKGMNWFTKIVGWIVQFALGLLVVFLFFSIPRLIVNPVMLLISYFRLLDNGLVLFLNFLVYVSATYLFFVWMALLMNQFLTAAILSVITFAVWWYFYKHNIKYNRCPSCHTMNVGLSLGSTYHGRTSSVSWGTYDVYKGTTETSTQIIRNYERRDKKTTTYTDHYTDHRECISCGYRWGVQRDVSAGSSTKRY